MTTRNSTIDLSEHTTACCVEISGVYPDSTPDLIEVAKLFAEQQEVKYIEIMIIQHERPLMIFYYSKKSINNAIIDNNLSILSEIVPYCIKSDELKQKFEQAKNCNCFIRLTQSDTKQVKNINFNKLIGCLQNGASRFFSVAISKKSQTCCIFSDNSSALDATKDTLCNTILGDFVIANHGSLGNNFNDISNYITRRFNNESNATNFKLIISQDSLPIILKSPSYIDATLQKGDGIPIGKTSSGLQIYLPLKQFTTHTLVLGSSGTGKTTFLYHTIAELTKKGIPSLIFDLNGSFSKLIKCTDLKDKLHIFKFNSKAAPCPISLFQLPDFCSVVEYKTQISNLFINVFDLGAPYNQIVREVIDDIYSEKGYLNDDKVANKNGYPSYADFENSLKRKINNSSYKQESRQTFEAVIINRVSTLKECLGDYMGLKIEELLASASTSASIIALNNVEEDIRPIILLYILKMLELYLKSESNKLNKKLNAVCVIDEAHILFGNRDENVQSLTDYTINLLNEMRQYRLGIVLSDQRYSIMEAVYNSTDTHIIYNIEDGRETIASKLDINVNIIKNLERGNAILSTKASSGSKIDPIPLNMRYLDSPGGNVTEDDLSNRMKSYWNSKSTNEIKPYRNCNCNKTPCDIRLKESVFEKYTTLRRKYTDGYISENQTKFFTEAELNCYKAMRPQIEVDPEVKLIAPKVMQEAQRKEFDNIRNDKARLLTSSIDKLYPQTYTTEFKNLVLRYLNINYPNWNTKTK